MGKLQTFSVRKRFCKVLKMSVAVSFKQESFSFGKANTKTSE